MTKATARWSGHRTRFRIESGSGHTADADEPAPLSDDAGMRPTEMLLGALGACTGVNAVLLLKKQRQAYRSLAVEVEGESAGEWPKAFTKIDINFVIEWEEGFSPDAEKVDMALDQACNRYCPVDATLSQGTVIGHRRTDRDPDPAPL